MHNAAQYSCKTSSFGKYLAISKMLKYVYLHTHLHILDSIKYGNLAQEQTIPDKCYKI